MVNDQLIRIHHMRLLSYDKMMTQQLEEQRAAALASGGAGDRADLQACSSSPSSPGSRMKSLSCSAPEAALLGRRHSFSKQEQQEQGQDSSSLDGKRRKQLEADGGGDESPLSKSHSFLPAMKHYGAGGGANKFAGHLEHSYNGSPIDASKQASHKSQHQLASSRQHQQQATGNKSKKSSWRHLLSPSYKSRSEEFRKFFADEIGTDERLIADYSCALHREILIQGRVYISINYIAFYSNLFSWITRLVVRWRDIADIYKANTARIIPNAIQILTNSGEKHVFASFIARDKSFVMFWRIWRNSLLMERMSDEELRSLVHLSYGKDLGMSTDEELKITSCEPATKNSITPSNLTAGAAGSLEQQVQGGSPSPDGNNNNDSRSSSKSETSDQQRDTSTSGAEQPTSGDKVRREAGENELPEGDGPSHQGDSRVHNTNLAEESERLASELGDRLNLEHISPPLSPPSSGRQGEPPAGGSPWIELTSSPSGNSNSILLGAEQPEVDCERSAQPEVAQDQPEGDKMSTRAAHFKNLFGRKSTSTTSCESTLRNESGELPEVWNGADGGETAPRQEPDELVDKQQPAAPVEGPCETVGECAKSGARDEVKRESAASSAGEAPTACDCQRHEGLLVADEQFDISVDTLFSLIFTNSKFMRAHMHQRGMTDAIVSKWRRQTTASTKGAGPAPPESNNPSSGDKSNSSTLSRSLDGGSAGGCAGNGSSHSRRNSIDSNAYLTQRPRVKTRQERQLNYSMNINHVLAKQIQVEERQNICSVRPGVYVLKSQSVNSGVPFSESFTVDLTYCMTRAAGGPNRSRMLVHGGVNFIKDKHSWKLAMVKSVIEKQSVQGINEFVAHLIERIREYIEKRQQLAGPDGQEADWADQVSLLHQHHQDQELYRATSTAPQAGNQNYTGAAEATSERSSRSLVRAKSKLKERKLRSMYKYYIQPADSNGAAASNQLGQPDGLSSDSDDSLNSSLGGIHEDQDDNDSMIMMMARHETDASSQLDERHASVRSASRLAARGQSFSDLECGQSMDEEEDGAVFDCCQLHNERYSETSNVTINNNNNDNDSNSNGKLAANCARGRPTWLAARRQRKETARDGCHLSSSTGRACATCAAHLAPGSGGRPLCGRHLRATRAPLYKKSAGELASHFCNRNLVSLAMLLLALALLCVSLAGQMAVLRRLEGIEARLAPAAHCADRWPAANQSAARLP